MGFFNELSKRATEITNDISAKADQAVDLSKNFVADVTESAERTFKSVKDKADDVWDNAVEVNLEEIKEADFIKTAFDKIDSFFQPQTQENIKEAISSASSNLLEVCKDASIDATIIASSYYTACEYAVGELIEDVDNLGNTVTEGLNELYSNSETAAKIYDKYGIDPESVGDKVDELVETTEHAAKATCYIATRFTIGTGRLFDKAIRGVGSIVEYCKGNPEEAKRIITNSSLDSYVDYVNEIFDETEFVESIGDAADLFGEIATNIALTVVSMGVLTPATSATVAIEAATEVSTLTTVANSVKAIASVSTLAVGAMGDKLEKNVEKTGELTDKEISSAIVRGCTTAVTVCLNSVVNSKLIESSAKIVKYLDKSIANNVKLGGKILGTVSHIAIGGFDAGTYKISEEVGKVYDYVLKIEDEFDVKKELGETVGTIASAAALSGVSYYLTKTIKDSATFEKIMKALKGDDYVAKPDYFDELYRTARLNLEPIKIDCVNEKFVNDKHPETEVPYSKKIIEMDGRRYEVVTPDFDSTFDLKLPNDQLLSSDKVQFTECNKQLLEAVKTNPELAKQFDEEQLEQIYNGETPDGFTWHHSEEPGKMQLVDSETHSSTGHTGGRKIWGGGTANR